MEVYDPIKTYKGYESKALQSHCNALPPFQWCYINGSRKGSHSRAWRCIIEVTDVKSGTVHIKNANSFAEYADSAIEGII